MGEMNKEVALQKGKPMRDSERADEDNYYADG